MTQGERIICLSSQYPGRVPLARNGSGPLRHPLFGLAPDGVFRASSLALRAVGSYSTFSPLPSVKFKSRVQDLNFTEGGLFSVALSVGNASRHCRPRVSQRRRQLTLAASSYAASRPVVFGLSSPAPLARPGAILRPSRTEAIIHTQRLLNKRGSKKRGRRERHRQISTRQKTLRKEPGTNRPRPCPYPACSKECDRS